MDKFSFGENLKKLRGSNLMMQKQVAEALHCSVNKYASWEQGRTEPDIESIRALCRIFNVSADELLEPFD